MSIIEIDFKLGEIKMRKINCNVDEIKEKILSLKGSEVEMNINRGRKKYDIINGTIKDVYPSVFTVIVKDNNSAIQTFSYYDVLCGRVTFL